MATLHFSFSPGVGYTGAYTIVAFGNTNPSIPLGQKTIPPGYGSTITDTITGVTPDAPYLLKFYTATCQQPVGTLIIPT